METQTATVIAVSDGKLTLSVDRAVSCARCAAGRGCGAGVLDGDGRQAVLEIDVPAGRLLRPGDVVELSMPSQDLLHASFLAYGVPLTAMVLVLAVVRMAVPDGSDMLSVAAATAALMAAHLATRRWLRRRHCADRLRPQVTGPSCDA